MKHLLKLLSDEEHYFPIFLMVLGGYAALGCCLMGYLAQARSSWFGFCCVILFVGAVIIALASRAVHVYAFNKEHSRSNEP